MQVNFGAIPEELIDSELFGPKGSFPARTEKQIGKFEQADRADFPVRGRRLSPKTQAKVLRVLLGGRGLRLGSRERSKGDVRVELPDNRSPMRNREGHFPLGLSTSA